MSIIDVWLEYYPIFLKGALGTLEFAAIAVFFGTLIGTFIAIMHLSKFKILQWIAKIYTTVLRGTPLLVQMYMAYFFIPMAFPVLDLPKEVCVVLSMVLNSSAYVSEIIRGGILSVDKGQTEAARSLGMSASHCMTKIVLPQAVRAILPSLAGEYIAMIKETSLAGTFMLYELMFTRVLLANKFLMWQPLFIISGMYLAMTLVLTALVSLLEKRFSERD